MSIEPSTLERSERSEPFCVLTAALLVTIGCACDQAPPAQETNAPAAQDTSTTRDPWQAARDRGIEFRALGQEPGWFLEIDDGRSIRLVWDYMEHDASFPAPPPTRNDSVRTFSASTDAHELSVRIDNIACQDVMSGFSFPNTVLVTIDGRELRGCGRDLN
jgi:putative lipoprotein